MDISGGFHAVAGSYEVVFVVFLADSTETALDLFALSVLVYVLVMDETSVRHDFFPKLSIIIIINFVIVSGK